MGDGRRQGPALPRPPGSNFCLSAVLSAVHCPPALSFQLGHHGERLGGLPGLAVSPEGAGGLALAEED